MSTSSPFSSDDPVYRAARSKSWIQDRTVTEAAFYRRFKGDSQGISVAKTAEIAEKALERPKGMIRIGVGDIRSVRDKDGKALDVVADLTTEGKGNIVDPPCFDDPDPARAEEGTRLARVLAKLAHPHP